MGPPECKGPTFVINSSHLFHFVPTKSLTTTENKMNFSLNPIIHFTRSLTWKLPDLSLQSWVQWSPFQSPLDIKRFPWSTRVKETSWACTICCTRTVKWVNTVTYYSQVQVFVSPLIIDCYYKIRFSFHLAFSSSTLSGFSQSHLVLASTADSDRWWITYCCLTIFYLVW